MIVLVEIIEHVLAKHGINCRREPGHAASDIARDIAASLGESVGELTNDQIQRLRDVAESEAACAQIALGFYESGSPVEPERVASARRACVAMWNTRYGCERER